MPHDRTTTATTTLATKTGTLQALIQSPSLRPSTNMASMNFSGGKQHIRPPQRGIFPLDHDAECKAAMETYLSCLKESKDMHHKCRDLSKEYLQCRMDRDLMAKEDLDKMGFSQEAKVKGAEEYDKSKEKGGYVAGKHMDKPNKWWFQKSGKKDWEQ